VEKCSSGFPFKLRELLWVVFDTPEDFVEFFKKPRTQSRSLVFVPQRGCLDVQL
jgi:hypothetical protein